ncbi:MAG: ROK family protein [Phycisphaerae bacterium]
MAGQIQPRRRYMGVDVGGTKIQATLVEESGAILSRNRVPTPREGGSAAAVDAIAGSIADLLDDQEMIPEDLAAIGIAVAGVVDPDAGSVVITPNMELTGVSIVPELRDRFGVPVALGNDTNMGTLGERWLGAARQAESVLGVLVGTGIGGGFVEGTALMQGYRNCATEIGHMVMEMDGPECGCGNKGCFEALASRTAMDRDIRAAIDKGRKSVMTDLLAEKGPLIRSGMLRTALQQEDKVVTRVMTRASEIIGLACLSARHMLDPEIIVLGGGVVEACGDFMLPIIQGVLDTDGLTGSRPPVPVRLAALGDDAVVLGAVALARQEVGRSAFHKRYRTIPIYPRVEEASYGEITIGGKTYSRDAYIRASGNSKKRKKSLAKGNKAPGPDIDAKEMDKICRGGPAEVFIGTGFQTPVEVLDDAMRFCRDRAIECTVASTPEAIRHYHRSKKRRALFARVLS